MSLSDEQNRIDDLSTAAEFDDIERELDEIISSSERDDVPVHVTHDIADSVYRIRNAIETIVDSMKDISADLGTAIDDINNCI